MAQHTDDFKGKSAQATAELLQVDPKQGLNQAEIGKRRQQYGYNEIEEHAEALWHRIFRHIWQSVRRRPLYFPGKQIFC